MQHELEVLPSRHHEVVSISSSTTFPGNKPTTQKPDQGTPMRTSKPARRILTPSEAAELLGCDDKTITRWARQGYIPAHPMGQGKKKYWRFFEDELIDWLMGQRNGAWVA